MAGFLNLGSLRAKSGPPTWLFGSLSALKYIETHRALVFILTPDILIWTVFGMCDPSEKTNHWEPLNYGGLGTKSLMQIFWNTVHIFLSSIFSSANSYPDANPNLILILDLPSNPTLTWNLTINYYSDFALRAVEPKQGWIL